MKQKRIRTNDDVLFILGNKRGKVIRREKGLFVIQPENEDSYITTRREFLQKINIDANGRTR
jgi:hypothetical protein